MILDIINKRYETVKRNEDEISISSQSYQNERSLPSYDESRSSSHDSFTSLSSRSSSSIGSRTCDERALALMAIEASMDSLLECLARNGAQHIQMDDIRTKLSSSEYLDYLQILTMAQNHVMNLMKSPSVSVTAKRSITNFLMVVWNDVSEFMHLQHRVAYRKYRTLRRKYEELEATIPPKSDRFVCPSVYEKLKRIHQHKVQKALSFVKVVAELYCESRKGVALTEILIKQIS